MVKATSVLDALTREVDLQKRGIESLQKVRALKFVVRLDQETGAIEDVEIGADMSSKPKKK